MQAKEETDTRPDLATVMRNIFVNMIDEDDIIFEENDESRDLTASPVLSIAKANRPTNLNRTLEDELARKHTSEEVKCVRTVSAHSKEPSNADKTSCDKTISDIVAAHNQTSNFSCATDLQRLAKMIRTSSYGSKRKTDRPAPTVSSEKRALWGG